MVKTVGIVSLSSGILGEAFVEHEVRLGLQRLEGYGLKIKFLPHAPDGMEALREHPEHRAADLLAAFAAPEIDMILCAIGGDDTYTKLVGVIETIAGTDAELTGWAMAPQGEAILLKATDQQGRPIFIENVNDDRAIARVLGARVERSRRVYAAGTPNTVGFAGDWTKARYGIVDGINLAISEEASINTGTEIVNTWQRNMFAVRVEAEVGFVVKDAAAFVKLTDATE